MEASAGKPREIVVPASILGSLRKELSKEAGALPAIHALHAAGYAAGCEAAPSFQQGQGEAVSALPQSAFWKRLGSHLAKRGWGSLQHSAPHRAVGVLTSPDLVESGDDRSDDASCSFTSGFLSGLLSELAGGPVAVLEIRCRGRGDDECAFAFGAEGAIDEVYGRLSEGVPFDEALADL